MKPRKNRFLISAGSALLLAPAALLLVSSTAFAGNTWDGGGSAVAGLWNWSDNLNWDSDSLPSYGTLLTFAGSTGLTSNNNGATSSIAGITFSSGAGAFTLSGSSVTLGGNITNSSSSLQTVNLPLVLDANRTVTISTGDITLGGVISGGFNLVVSGGTARTVTMNTAGSSYNRLQINSATTKLGVDNALPTSGGVTFASGINGGTLDLNGKTQTLGSTIVFAGSTAAGTAIISDSLGGGLLKLGGDVTQNATTGSPAVNISAALDLNGSTRTFTTNNASGIMTVSGSISNSTGTAGLTKAGSATSQLILSGANTYNGSTTVSAGLLTLSNSLALQNSTLDTTASIASSNASTGLKTTVTTLTLGGLSGNKNLASLFDSTNGFGGVTALILNPALGQTPSYSGIIANGASGMTLTKTGNGTQTLSVANTYSGGTILSGGILNYGHATALSSGPISFTGNSTLQAGVETTVANAVSVASGVTGTLDTNGNATTLSGALTGDGNLTKSGAGTLTLTGGVANTLAGAINIDEGTLNITDGLSLTNTPGTITVASGGTLSYTRAFSPVGNNLPNAISLSGPGAGGSSGALHLYGNVIASGPITLADDATITHSFNNATISGSITGTNRNLTLKTNTNGQPGMAVSAPIQLGTGGVTVTGAANSGSFSINLSGDNSYSGGTLVTAGTLMVSNTTGSATGSGAVNVASGATLGGTGRIAGAVNVSGVLSPGASIESLGTGTLTLNSGSNLKYEMDTSTVAGDLLYVTGDLNIGSNVTLDLTDLAALSQALTAGTKFTLLSYTGLWNNGTFTGYADDSTFVFANNEWRINYNDLSGGANFTSDQTGATGFVTLAVIPEPSSLGLLGLGGLGALLVRRRRGN